MEEALLAVYPPALRAVGPPLKLIVGVDSSASHLEAAKARLQPLLAQTQLPTVQLPCTLGQQQASQEQGMQQQGERGEQREPHQEQGLPLSSQAGKAKRGLEEGVQKRACL